MNCEVIVVSCKGLKPDNGEPVLIVKIKGSLTSDKCWAAIGVLSGSRCEGRGTLIKDN